MRMLNYTPDVSPFHRGMSPTRERTDTRNSSPTRRGQASSQDYFTPSIHNQAWVKRRIKRDERYARQEVSSKSLLSHECISNAKSTNLSQSKYRPYSQPVQSIKMVEHLQDTFYKEASIEHREQPENREQPVLNYASITDMDFMDSNTLTDVSDLTNCEEQLDSLQSGDMKQLQNAWFLNQTTGVLEPFQFARNETPINNSKRKFDISMSEKVTIGRFSGMSLQDTMVRRKSISDRKQGTTTSLPTEIMPGFSKPVTIRSEEPPRTTRNGLQKSCARKHSEDQSIEEMPYKDETLSSASNATSHHPSSHNLDLVDTHDLEKVDKVPEKKQTESRGTHILSSNHFLSNRPRWKPRSVHKNIHKFIETFDRLASEQLPRVGNSAGLKKSSLLSSTHDATDAKCKQLNRSASDERSVSMAEKERMLNFNTSAPNPNPSQTMCIHSDSLDSEINNPQVQKCDSKMEEIANKIENLDISIKETSPILMKSSSSTHKTFQRSSSASDVIANTSASDTKGSSADEFQSDEVVDDLLSSSASRSAPTSNSETYQPEKTSGLECVIKIKDTVRNHLNTYSIEDVKVNEEKRKQESNVNKTTLSKNNADSLSSDHVTMKRNIHKELLSSLSVKIGKAPAEKSSIKLPQKSHSKSEPEGCHEKDDKGQSQSKKYEKYSKMMKMGLPIGAVNHAIRRDGLDPEKVLNIMNGKVELDGSPDIIMEQPKVDNTTERPKDMYRRTRLYWIEITHFSETSLWSRLESDADLNKVIIDDDEFRSLFEAKKSSIKKVDQGENSTTRSVVKVLNSKRANNGGIVLARLKMTYDEIAISIDTMDESSFTVEQVQGLMEYIPTEKECRDLEKFTEIDVLCECEKFMTTIMKIPEAKRKLDVIFFKLNFPIVVKSLETEMATMLGACKELCTSVRLRKFLGVVLKVGNRLNKAGNDRISSKTAFSISSLPELNQVKAWDKKTTILSYIVALIHKASNGEILNVRNDLPNVIKSQKMSLNFEGQLQDLSQQIDKMFQTALILAPPDFETRQEESNTSTELIKLRASPLGTFVLDAKQRLLSLQANHNVVTTGYVHVLEYFAESEMSPNTLFTCITSFCDDLEAVKATLAKLKTSKGVGSWKN